MIVRGAEFRFVPTSANQYNVCSTAAQYHFQSKHTPSSKCERLFVFGMQIMKRQAIQQKRRGGLTKGFRLLNDNDRAWLQKRSWEVIAHSPNS
ncbi:hypothetical protein Trydic_g4006 [Trypoxylus dichotomus]